jgi:hypothetical protein
MIVFVIGDNKTFRQKSIADVMVTLQESDHLIFDDTLITVPDLEQYLYPSLFTLAAPVIHLKFLLDGDNTDFHTERIKKLMASPTIFIFEELSVPASVLTTVKKHGAIVHTSPKVKSSPKEDTLFNVTKALTAGDKKARWLAFRDAMEKHSIEAVMGILYWKARELAVKKSADQQTYRELYQALLQAHARAWQTGAPLELLIEKVILTK